METAPLENPIQGVWLNNFGSIMRLEIQNGRISGCYSSTTGSSGAYRLVGFADAPPVNSDPANTLVTLAFALPWRSYMGGKGDTSWHWTSTMSGVYFLDNKDHLRKLELVNALDATTVFPGQNAEVGVYPESLTFELYHDQSWPCPSAAAATKPLPVPDDRMINTWTGDGIEIVLEQEDGVLGGRYTDAEGSFPLVGVYDSDPASPPPVPKGVVAVSLVASNVSVDGVNRHSQVALSGTYDIRTNALSFFTFRTFPTVNYTSNKLGRVTLAIVG